MASDNVGGAASSLLATLFDDSPVALNEVARSSVSVHYETGTESLPVICVCTPDAVRLPNALVTLRLPLAGHARIGAGVLVARDATFSVTRWWSPPRPRGLTFRPRPDLVGLVPADTSRDWAVGLSPSYDGLQPASLVGAGPGLTPAGDDVLAGALVAASAIDDLRLSEWQHDVDAQLASGRTTAVSRGLLHCALGGFATTELADFVHAVCDGTPPMLRTTATDLLAVGHTSGAALMAGVLHTVSTTLI